MEGTPTVRPARLIQILSGFTVLSASLAYLFIVAEAGRVQPAAGAALVAWLSYLVVHRAETGTLLDIEAEEKQLPSAESDWVVFGLSSFLFIAGMVFGSAAVADGNLIEATFGAGILLAGYFIAHYELTDDLV